MALNTIEFQFFTIFQLLSFLVSLCTSHAYLPRGLVSRQDLSSSAVYISMLNTAQPAASRYGVWGLGLWYFKVET